jgi:hypothetical protein
VSGNPRVTMRAGAPAGPPSALRVGGASREVHAARAELQEEEHIKATKPDRLNSEEIARNDRLGVRAQELAPAETSPRAGRRHAGLSQDLRDACRRGSHAHTGELTNDSLVAPARVLTRKPQHQRNDIIRDRWSARPPSSVRPPFPHKLAMPAEQRVRANEERRPAPRALSSRLAAARKTRSVSPRRGRATSRRRTASSWRSTTISSSLNSRERRRSAATASARRKSRYSNDTTKRSLPPSSGSTKGRLYGCKPSSGTGSRTTGWICAPDRRQPAPEIRREPKALRRSSGRSEPPPKEPLITSQVAAFLRRG